MSTGNVTLFIRNNRHLLTKKAHQAALERRARELTATNKELETFSSTLSHDMRSYITRVSTASQLLLDNHLPDLNEEGQYLLRSIHQAGEDMEQLVESIQRISSIATCEMNMEQVDLSELATTIALQLQMNEMERKVDFVIEPGLSATCDPRLIKVALENLLGNAWKYTGMMSAARIEFGREPSGRQNTFSVRDNGLGFCMEESGRLFEPFYRLPNAKGYPGTGIGLATVLRVIQLHHGELWGIGKPGEGATFYFTLPEGVPPAASRSDRQDARLSPKGQGHFEQ